MASDSRSNAGFDQVNVCRKMYRFVTEGERVFVILTSGSLSISQSVISLLRVDFDAGLGLAQAPSIYHAARIVGETVRQVSEIDRASLERDNFSFNVNLLLGGQVRGEPPTLYLIYPQGNPAAGDRGLSVPAARRSEVRPADSRSRHPDRARRSKSRPNTRCSRSMRPCARTSPSGRPSTCCCTSATACAITRYRRLGGSDPDLNLIHASWEQSLRRAVEQLPEIEFEDRRSRSGRGRR